MSESHPESHRARSPNDWRAWLPRVLVESTLIVFSVLLALAVDGWQASRRERAQAETATREIVAEVRANRAAVAESYRYHRELVGALAALRGDPGVPDIRQFPRGFVMPAQISRTAWTSAAETGALAHMDYDRVLQLSRVYAEQDRYLEQTAAVTGIIFGELYQGGYAAILANFRNLSGIISSFTFREHQLLERYAATLGEPPPPPLSAR